LTTGNDVVYLYDGWRRVRDYKLDGETWMPTREYVWGGTYIDELIAFTDDTDEDGDFEDAGGSERYLVCQQANYNVVAIVKASTAEVVETITYDPYGQPDVEQVGAASPTGNAVLFQGREWDDDADLYYFRNRWYSPVLGRFVQRDPMGYGDGMNPYGFVRGNPLIYADPAGLAVGCPGGEWWFSGTVIGGQLGILGYTYTDVKFECKKKLLVGRWHWCCEDGAVVEFTQDVYHVPVAIGGMRSARIGQGLGGMSQGILGSVTGKPTSDDLSGSGWAGVTAPATAIAVGGAASKGPSSESFRGGIGTSGGLGVSITTGWTWVTIHASFMEVQEQGGFSSWDAKLRINVLKLKCTKRYEKIDPPEVVDHLGPGGGPFE